MAGFYRRASPLRVSGIHVVPVRGLGWGTLKRHLTPTPRHDPCPLSKRQMRHGDTRFSLALAAG